MKLKRIMKILIVFLVLIFAMQTVTLAGDFLSVNQFDSYSNQIQNTPVDSTIHKVLGIILTVVRTVTFGWSIFSLIVIAIYMMTNASPFDSIRLKENHIPTYVVGVILLFGATGILQLITYFIDDTVGSGSNVV